jgi:UDP:flavonoid glycosyltransferase YjiC (YdhE family)
VKVLCAVAPAYGLMYPVVPLIWAARAAGHEVLVASTSDMIDAGARAGLPMYNVVPDRDVWAELTTAITLPPEQRAGAGVSEEFREAARSGNPFALFTLTMTEGTIDAGHAFGADLVVHTSDHTPGALAALAIGVPALEVGNRVSWSMRDTEFATGRDTLVDDEVVTRLRDKLGLPEGRPRVLARIDPRAPSMGGLTTEHPDPRDGAPWWSMRYLPYNGGGEVPDWALREPARPRVCVTLGTVVPAMLGSGLIGVVLEALAELDVEVVLASGSADLDGLTLPENVRPVGYLPLSSVLPHCALIVHHGGSGTTASPLHYGVPQLVLPSFADNPLSARRVVERGVGLSMEPADADPATVRSLAEQLLTEPAFAKAAAEVSAEMATQPTPYQVFHRAAELLNHDPAPRPAATA